MPFPLALPVALSAIQALLKFRGRLDTILSLNEATTGLPFALPPAPADDAPHIDPMVAFFTRPEGEAVLVLRGLLTEWSLVRTAPHAPTVQEERGRLLQAYYEAAELTPEHLGPDEAANRARAARGPSREMRLAYYVIESHRLSRNPAVTRVLLAAADTLLEFGADNASLVVANPRTRGLVESLLRNFAVDRDWDDASAEIIFTTLLGATAAAALENRGNLPDRPVLHALFDALGDVQGDLGADFVAKLVSREGFTKLVGHLLIQTADQPGLLPDQPVLKEALAAMLRETGRNLDGILGDPQTLAGVLEAGLAAAAGAAVPLIGVKLGDQPLLAVVLAAVAQEFQKAGDQRVLFRELGNGEFFTALYRASLHSVAANPQALASQANLQQHVAVLIAACADELAQQPLADALSIGTLRALAVRSLEVLSEQPEFLAGHGEFAAKVIGAALAATSGALRHGFTTADLTEIADTIVRTAAANLGLVQMDDRLRVVLTALGQALGDAGLAKLTTAPGRKAVFFAGLEAVAANPQVWTGFAEKELVQPLVSGVLRALATDTTGLLAGPALVPVFRQVLLAAARRGQTLLSGQQFPSRIEQVLTAALRVAKTEIGVSLDAETLPLYLQRVVLAALTAPFPPASVAELEAWLHHQTLALT